MQNHNTHVATLQKVIQESFPTLFSLAYGKGYSNTTRSKSYKKNTTLLDCGKLDSVLEIDIEKKVAKVEPRVTMEKLVLATLAHGLLPPVVPEFRGITVGGAILGAAAESSSHKQGIFSDNVLAYEILTGDGKLLRLTPTVNSELFYAIPGSYGSFGLLVLIELELIVSKPYVEVFPQKFKKASDALSLLRKRPVADFVDGIVYAQDETVIFLANFTDQKKPTLSQNRWYYKAARTGIPHTMKTVDYLFRFDQGAFWMGAYLYKLPLLLHFLLEGFFKIKKEKAFTLQEIESFRKIFGSTLIPETLFMKSQSLWRLLHKAEKWVQERFIIQDFCIPEENALAFLEKVLERPQTFPLWLCPIMGTTKPELFSPHLLPTLYINVGVYGLPSTPEPIASLTKELEILTHNLKGRKVLYSHSYYTEDEFWNIYPKEPYEALRSKVNAKGAWRCITEKVLSS